MFTAIFTYQPLFFLKYEFAKNADNLYSADIFSPNFYKSDRILITDVRKQITFIPYIGISYKIR